MAKTNNNGDNEIVRLETLILKVRKATRHNGKPLTQAVLARHLGYANGNVVSQWELGKKIPHSVSIIRQIAQRCHCSDDKTKEFIDAYWNAIRGYL